MITRPYTQHTEITWLRLWRMCQKSKKERGRFYPTWLVETSSMCKYPCHLSWQLSPCCLFAVTWPTGAWRQGRAEKALESTQLIALPHPHGALSSSPVSGALDQIACFRCQRDTFLFALRPRMPSICPSPEVGVANDKLFWNKSFCFFLFLSPFCHTKLLEHFWLLSITWRFMLEIWVCCCSL